MRTDHGKYHHRGKCRSGYANLNGHDLTFKIRETRKKDNLAIIAISSLDKQETISKILRFGAKDVVNKPFSDNEIITRVNANLELLDLFSQIKEMANKDFLSGLYNRRYFFDAGKPIFSKNRRKKTSIAVAMVDIDKFKNINDTYGHAVGDILLVKATKILSEIVANDGIIIRWGGDEFIIILDGYNKEATINILSKIKEEYNNENKTQEEPSKKYGLTQQSISKVIKGITWT